MSAAAAGSCSSPRKVIVVCIVHTATPGARLFNREALAAPERNPAARIRSLVRGFAPVFSIGERCSRGQLHGRESLHMAGRPEDGHQSFL